MDNLVVRFTAIYSFPGRVQSSLVDSAAISTNFIFFGTGRRSDTLSEGSCGANGTADREIGQNDRTGRDQVRA